MRGRNQTANRASITAGIDRAANVNPRTAMEAVMEMPVEAVMMETMVMETARGCGAGRKRGKSQ